jgi:tetratricopeptide (TPR) repeat protein
MLHSTQPLPKRKFSSTMSNRSHGEEGIGPLERGRGRYSQKDYVGALAAFKEAVEITTGNLLLTALDHRAATYEKLNKLQAALRDSKEMIDLKPDFAKVRLSEPRDIQPVCLSFTGLHAMCKSLATERRE